MAVMDGDRRSSTDKVYIQKLNTDEYQQLLNPSSDLDSTSDENFFQSVIYTPAITTRGAKEDLMLEIADMIETVLNAPEDDAVIAKVRSHVNELMGNYPIFAW